MPFRFRTLPALLLLSACAPASPPGGEEGSGSASLPPAAVREQVAAVLEGVNEAASRKDVDAFMALWERSDSLVYVRSGQAFLGWEAVRENHREGFSTPGTWSFQTGEIHVRVLGPQSGVGTAFIRTSAPRWFLLTATVTETPSGWRIVQAHGSYAEGGRNPFGEVENPGDTIAPP